MPLPERSHRHGGDYLDLMTVRRCQTSPVVGGAAGLKNDQTRILLRQELGKLDTRKLLVQQLFVGRCNDRNLNNVFGEINAGGVGISHGSSPLNGKPT